MVLGADTRSAREDDSAQLALCEWATSGQEARLAAGKVLDTATPMPPRLSPQTSGVIRPERPVQTAHWTVEPGPGRELEPELTPGTRDCSALVLRQSAV